MYDWRHMSARERQEALDARKAAGHPWHAPPHDTAGQGAYHVSAACYQHAPIIGSTVRRMGECEDELLATLGSVCDAVYAWCVLPNHYHVLVDIGDLRALSAALGRLHGRTAFRWNGEDGRRGCHVWHRCTDRRIRSDRHFWATLNYVHHNPVHHGYAKGWEDWPFSSARSFLRAVGRDKAATLWKAYPLLDYGRGWDEPGL